tara:strand:+ start:385 stop:567 length:183 start_codon:yes stop_codon:yes gene_type:complete
MLTFNNNKMNFSGNGLGAIAIIKSGEKKEKKGKKCKEQTNKIISIDIEPENSKDYFEEYV